MNDFNTVRGSALELFTALESMAGDRGADVTESRLIAGRERLEQGRLVAVVCGEFKRGKSSLLNALLHDFGETPLFPEATEIATNVVTTVSYGEQETITVLVDGKGGDPEVVEIERADIARYVTESGNPKNSKRARLIEIQTPNPRLSSGLTLVDTPGVGGVYTEHTAATMAILPSADAIVFVTDVTQPLLESELRFLRRTVESLSVVDSPDALQFVLTKIDIGEYETMLENTRRKVAGLLNRPPDQVVITPVSAHAMRDYLRSGDPDDLELSNFQVFESALWSGLNRWQTKRLLSAALQDQERAVQALLQPLDSEVAALADDTKQQVAALTREAEDRQRRLSDLQSIGSTWRTELVSALSRVGRELDSQGQGAIEHIWRRFETDYLWDDSYLFNPDRLVGQLQADAATVIGELNELSSRKLAGVLAEFTNRNGLNLNSPELEKLPNPPVPNVRVTGTLGQNQQSANIKRKLRDASLGASIGGGVGLLVGSLLIPFAGPAGPILGFQVSSMVGGLVGAGVGYLSGAKDVANSDRELRRSSLRTELNTVRNSQIRYVGDAVTAVIQALTESLVAELENRIAAEKESATDEVARLASARAATKSKAKARTAELTAERTSLVDMRTRIAALARAVDHLSATAIPPPAGTPQVAAEAYSSRTTSAGLADEGTPE